MTDVAGNPEEERSSEFYNQTWTEEAVHRYFYRQVRPSITKSRLEYIGISVCTVGLSLKNRINILFYGHFDKDL